MVVILEPDDFEGWLTCPVAPAKDRYCKQWPGLLVGEPAPLPKRGTGVVRASRDKPNEPPPGSSPTVDLF
jgi:hypothetical protein